MFRGDQGRCLVALRCRRFAVSSSNPPVLHPLDSSVRSPWRSAGLPFLSRFAAIQAKPVNRLFLTEADKTIGVDVKGTDPPELIQSAQHLLQLGHLLSRGGCLAVSIQVLVQF